MIYISSELRNEIIQLCVEKHPDEACGALLGRVSGHRIDICEIVPIPNSSARPHHHFTMDPQQWIQLLYASVRTDRQIVGIYHSHINTPAVPSEEDLQTLWYHLPSYWIVSLMRNAAPVIQVYKLMDSGYAELELL